MAGLWLMAVMTIEGPDDAPQAAGLLYVSDTEPGIRRLRAGKGFYYRDSERRRIADAAILSRIRALAIPPAWGEVWICPDPAGHIQATGRDARGRKQYRYHPDWTALRDSAKFSSLTAFARQLPKLRARVDADLRRRGLCRERVLATAVRLLDTTLVRVGNDAYAIENKSFGLTTLKPRHLDLQGSRPRFSFIGKSGQVWSLSVTDRRIARVIRGLHELPGQRLFQYLDDAGERRDIRSQDVNDYIRDALGPDSTSKHFRTWGATVSAAMALAEIEAPGSQRGRARALNAVLDEVARKLRNTRTVCRNCYAHPDVVAEWQEGLLGTQIAELRRRLRRPARGLERDEAIVLRWLSIREETAGGAGSALRLSCKPC
jgi:DNA topoisomerase I